MADIFWLGQSTAVAQVDTVQITAFDATTTYTLTVGGHTVSVVGTTDVNTTAAALQAAWAADTHPYVAAVTATVVTDTVTLTAATAGVPFVVTSSVTGGTGTIGAVTSVTASSGPNHWDDANNWSAGVVPVNSDTVSVLDSAVDILWGLDQSALTNLASLAIEQSFTGKIGLPSNVFTTSTTTTAAKPEYRDHYLKIPTTALDIGEDFGPFTQAGSGRIKIDLGTFAAQATIHNTSSSSTEATLPAVRLLANNAATDLFVRSSPGGVGFAMDEANETTTIGDVSVDDSSDTSRVSLSDGVTLTNWTQLGGSNVLQAAATVTLVLAKGGTLLIEGTAAITTMSLRSGGAPTVICNTTGTITTLNCESGIITFNGSSATRTVTTLNSNGGEFSYNPNQVTVSNVPASNVAIKISPAA